MGRMLASLALLAATLFSGRAWAQDPMSDPSVYAAQVLSPGSVIRETAGQYIIGKEPGVSLDGRLISFDGEVKPFDSRCCCGVSHSEASAISIRAALRAVSSSASGVP